MAKTHKENEVDQVTPDIRSTPLLEWGFTFSVRARVESASPFEFRQWALYDEISLRPAGYPSPRAADRRAAVPVYRTPARLSARHCRSFVPLPFVCVKSDLKVSFPPQQPSFFCLLALFY